MSRLFDVYIAVDWSSRKDPSPPGPSKDAIWVGERLALGQFDPTVVGETYFRTRLECRIYVRDRLLHHVNHQRRVFIGFDFAYGYPGGYASALDLTEVLPPWRRIWEELTSLIQDDARNLNNRFEVASQLNARCGDLIPGPLWGCPSNRQSPTLRTTSPGFPYSVGFGSHLSRLRRVEKKQSGAQETWKLYGAGSVGGQVLTGIPVLCKLRDDPQLAQYSRVWPFETGFSDKPTPDRGPFILHVEIFPGNIPDPLETGVDPRDRAQVRAVVTWLSRLDVDGRLNMLFSAPDNLSSIELETCAKEEGWIIGS